MQAGGVAVLRTDTLYGLVGSALNPETVARVKSLKDRPNDKPFIVLIADTTDLDKWGVTLTFQQQAAINKYWPGPVSLILPTREGNLAFRLPVDDSLRVLVGQTGPLVAPSANPRDLPPATNITEAKAYFGDQVDFYLDGGECSGQPSKLIDLTGEEEKILRG